MSENDYEDGRVTGQREQIANATVNAIGKLMEMGVMAMGDPGAKVSLLAGCAVPALQGIALAFGTKAEGQYHCTANEVILGAFYLIATVEDHEEGVIAGFNPGTLATALRLYKQVMGRDYTDITPVLIKMMKDEAEMGKEVPDHLKKFIPN